MTPDTGFDDRSDRSARVIELRAAVRAGRYAPDLDAVAESLIGWIATPEQFAPRIKKFGDGADSKVQTAKDHHSRR